MEYRKKRCSSVPLKTSLMCKNSNSTKPLRRISSAMGVTFASAKTTNNKRSPTKNLRKWEHKANEIVKRGRQSNTQQIVDTRIKRISSADPSPRNRKTQTLVEKDKEMHTYFRSRSMSPEYKPHILPYNYLVNEQLPQYTGLHVENNYINEETTTHARIMGVPTDAPTETSSAHDMKEELYTQDINSAMLAHDDTSSIRIDNIISDYNIAKQVLKGDDEKNNPIPNGSSVDKEGITSKEGNVALENMKGSLTNKIRKELNMISASPPKPHKDHSDDDTSSSHGEILSESFKGLELGNGYLELPTLKLGLRVSPGIIKLYRPDAKLKADKVGEQEEERLIKDETEQVGEVSEPIQRPDMIDVGIALQKRMDIDDEEKKSGYHNGYVDDEDVSNTNIKKSNEKIVENNVDEQRRVVMNYETCIDSGLTFLTSDTMGIGDNEWEANQTALNLPEDLKLAGRDNNKGYRIGERQPKPTNVNITQSPRKSKLSLATQEGDTPTRKPSHEPRRQPIRSIARSNKSLTKAKRIPLKVKHSNENNFSAPRFNKRTTKPRSLPNKVSSSLSRRNSNSANKNVSKVTTTKFRPILKNNAKDKVVEPSNTESCVDTGDNYPSHSKETFYITVIQKDQGKKQKGVIEMREHDSRIALRARAYHSASPRVNIRSSKRYRKSNIYFKNSTSPSTPNMFRKSTSSPKVNTKAHCESDVQNDIGEITKSITNIERDACETVSANSTSILGDSDVRTGKLEPTYIDSKFDVGLSQEIQLLSKITEESCANDLSNTQQTLDPTPSPTQEASGSGALLYCANQGISTCPKKMASSSTLKIDNLSIPHMKQSLLSRSEKDREEADTMHQHNAEASSVIGSQSSALVQGSAFTQTICSSPLLKAVSKIDSVAENSSTQTKNTDTETIKSNGTMRSSWSPHLYNIETLASRVMDYPEKVIPWLNSTEHEKILPNQEGMEQDFSSNEKPKTTFLVYPVREVTNDAQKQHELEQHNNLNETGNEMHEHNNPVKLPGQTELIRDPVEITPPAMLRRNDNPPGGDHLLLTQRTDGPLTVGSNEDTYLELVGSSTDVEKETSRSGANSRNISRKSSRKSAAPLDTLGVLCNSKFHPVDIDIEIHKHHYNTRFLRGRITVDSVLKRSTLGMMPPQSRNSSYQSVEDRAPIRNRNTLKRNRTNNKPKPTPIEQNVENSPIGDRQGKAASKKLSGLMTKKYSVDNANRNKEVIETNQTRPKKQPDNKVELGLNNSGENDLVRKESSSRSVISSCGGVREHAGTNKSKSNLKTQSSTSSYSSTLTDSSQLNSSSKYQMRYSDAHRPTKGNLIAARESVKNGARHKLYGLKANRKTESESNLSSTFWFDKEGDSLEVHVSASHNESVMSSTQRGSLPPWQFDGVLPKYHNSLTDEAFLDSIKPKPSIDVADVLLTYYGKEDFNPAESNDSEFRHHIDSKSDPDVRLLNKRSGPLLDYEGNYTNGGSDSKIDETTMSECSTSVSREKKRVRFSNRIPGNKYNMHKYIGIPSVHNQVNIQHLEGIQRKYKHFKRFGRDNQMTNLHAIETEDNEVESKASSIENISTLNNRLSFENQYSYNSSMFGSQYGKTTPTHVWGERSQPYTSYQSMYEPMRYVPATAFEDYTRTSIYDTYTPHTASLDRYYNGSSNKYGYVRDLHSYGDTDHTFQNIKN